MLIRHGRLHELHYLNSKGAYYYYGLELLARESVFIKHFRPLLMCSSQRTINNITIVQPFINIDELKHSYIIAHFPHQHHVKNVALQDDWRSYYPISRKRYFFKQSCLKKKRKNQPEAQNTSRTLHSMIILTHREPFCCY